MSITNPSQLLSLLTLSSTALPIGAYCYSQGVESAIDRGLIHDEASSIAYFEEVLEMLLVRFELPVLKRLMQYSDDEVNFTYWANFYRASRESKELLAESKQLAFSLNAWIRDVLKQPVKVKKQLGFVPYVIPMLAPIEKSARYAIPPNAVIATTLGLQRRKLYGA